MTARRARKLLGVRAGASAHEVRAAWREAAKAAHPDAGGEAERFHAVIEAYRVLQAEPAPTIFLPPIPRPCTPRTIEISPQICALGGQAEAQLGDGRRLRLTLPAGLRPGDQVRADGETLVVSVRGRDGTMVRGSDLWLTAKVAPGVLAEGGRVMVETPLGRRIVWVSRRAGARGLIRLAGHGLPPRGPHGQGDLFLRLQAEAPAESPARVQLRRFAAAWAA